MSEINLAPFFIGQRVVGSDVVLPASRIKKGHPYIIRECHFTPSLNPIANGKSFWYVCIEEWPDHRWLAPRLFTPVQENFQSITLEKCIEVETPLISVN